MNEKKNSETIQGASEYRLLKYKFHFDWFAMAFCLILLNFANGYLIENLTESEERVIAITAVRLFFGFCIAVISKKLSLFEILAGWLIYGLLGEISFFTLISNVITSIFGSALGVIIVKNLRQHTGSKQTGKFLKQIINRNDRIKTYLPTTLAFIAGLILVFIFYEMNIRIFLHIPAYPHEGLLFFVCGILIGYLFNKISDLIIIISYVLIFLIPFVIILSTPVQPYLKTLLDSITSLGVIFLEYYIGGIAGYRIFLATKDIIDFKLPKILTLTNKDVDYE